MSGWEILRVLLLGFPAPPEMIDPRYPACLQQLGGLALTFAVTVLSFLFGGPLGLALALARGGGNPTPRRGFPGRCLGLAAAGLVELVQGLPVVILVLLAFHLPYRYGAVRLPPALLAVAAFSLYNAVYLSGILQAGLRTVDPRWLDAARVLGLSRGQILWRIRLPLAVRPMVPALVGQAVTVFKDTSVLAVVAVGELTYSARQLQAAEPGRYGLVLLAVLLLYWGLATIGSVAVARLEAAWVRRQLA